MMKSILILIAISTLTLSFVVLANNDNYEYKKLKLNNTYDTLQLRVEKPSNLIFSITLKNTEGITIVEEWNYNSNETNYTISKYFTHNNIKYMEEWQYKKDCLTKINYLVQAAEQTSKETTYQWMENLNIKNCGQN